MLTCFPPADLEPCLDSELSEFPLRMRDWLKNVLVTLYERDEDNNLLTEKQKLRVSRHRSTVSYQSSTPTETVYSLYVYTNIKSHKQV